MNKPHTATTPWPPIQPDGREPTLEDIGRHILDRLRADGTADNAALMMVYRRDGAFRRVLFENLGEHPRGEHWGYEPAYQLTGARLRALCEAAANHGSLQIALEQARQEIVLAIAFLGRDLDTDRLNVTASSLVKRLSDADADIRERLGDAATDARK